MIATKECGARFLAAAGSASLRRVVRSPKRWLRKALAEHCTSQEDAAQKVERRMRKSEAALLRESHVGQQYDAIVTGCSESGQWVRIFAPPAEGRLASGPRGLEVGQKLRVKLVSTDVARGFIDFELVD